MNPFDLNGPNFLVFYGLCGAAVCLVLYLLRLQEPQTPEGAVPTDPQTIAYLRGGATEALRITAVTLLERGALVLGPYDTLRTDPNHTLPRDASAIDRLVCEHFQTEEPAVSLFENESLALRVAAHLARPLEEAGLLPDDDLRAARWSRLLAAVAALGTLAAVKIALALESRPLERRIPAPRGRGLLPVRLPPDHPASDAGGRSRARLSEAHVRGRP